LLERSIDAPVYFRDVLYHPGAVTANVRAVAPSREANFIACSFKSRVSKNTAARVADNGSLRKVDANARWCDYTIYS
jgi:hypothetical protein